MTIMLAAGERVPVDLQVTKGLSELDVSLVTGESVPQPALPGSVLRAGTLNLDGAPDHHGDSLRPTSRSSPKCCG